MEAISLYDILSSCSPARLAEPRPWIPITDSGKRWLAARDFFDTMVSLSGNDA